MADRHRKEGPSRLSKSISSETQLCMHGLPFHVNLDLLAARSSKIAAFIERDRREDIPYYFLEIEADAETLELVARFCHGFEVNLSPSNIIPIICVAYHLGMDETHSSNNLLNKAISFLEEKILPSWNESIYALRKSREHFLKQAEDLGLLKAFLDTIVENAIIDPRVLGEPIGNRSGDENHQPGAHDENNCNQDSNRPSARRRLFVLDWKSEDLTTLSLQLYEPIIRAMIQHNVPQEYIAGSVLNYVKRWILGDCTAEEAIKTQQVCKKKHQRDIIEAIDRLLPNQGGLVPCSLLFRLLQLAVELESSLETRKGFETRVGKQLDQASLKDSLEPFIACAKNDVECVRRILKVFYSNYKEPDASGFLRVAKLMEEFLAEVAAEADLNIGSFVSLAEMVVAASYGAQKCSDGIYRAVDIYLAKHGTLTESEKLEVCKVLDCHKLSPEACDHAANNQRLPLRVIVQVLFISQLQLRDSIMKEVQGEEGWKGDGADNDEEEEEEEVEEGDNDGFQHKEATGEAELVGEWELEKREIQNGCAVHRSGRKGKFSIWGEVKRKFGCMTGVDECNCQVKKKKKKIHRKSFR